MHSSKNSSLLFSSIMLCSLLAGCSAIKVRERSGTEFGDSSNGNKPTTYVSQEEYQRMTDDEKKHLNASVGASATIASWGNSNSTPKDVSSEALDKAVRKSKE